MPSKNLHVLMTADAKGVESAVARVEAGFKRLESSTAGLRMGLGALVGGADPLEALKGSAENLLGSVPGIGPALQGSLMLGESFFNKIRQTQKDTAEMGKQALGVGGTIEGYSALRFAVSDAEALDKALFKLNVSTVEAAEGGNEAADAFEALGLDAKAMMTLPAEEKFHKIADALRKVENNALRGAEAHKILGRSALGVMGDLMKGSEGLKKLEDLAREHGRVITKDDVANAQLVNATLKTINLETEKLWRTASTALAPAIASVAKDLEGIFSGGKGGDMQASQKALIEIKEGFTDAAQAAKGIFKLSWLNVSGAKEDFSKITGYAGATAKAEAEVNAWNEKVAAKKKEIEELEKNAAVNVESRVAKEREAAKLAHEMEQAKKAEYEFSDNLTKQAETLLQKSKDPLEKLKDDLLEADAVLRMFGADAEVVDETLGRMVNEFVKANEAKVAPTPLLQFGTAAEFSSRANLRSENAIQDGQAALLDTTRRLEQHARETKQIQKQLLEGAKKLGLLTGP